MQIVHITEGQNDNWDAISQMCWNEISPTHPPEIIWIIYTYIITLLQWENSITLFISPKYLDFLTVLHPESAKSREQIR